MKNKTTSGKDVNDALMIKAGFRRDLISDNPKFNACGRISYWINDNGLRIVTSKDDKLTLCQLIDRVTNQTAYQTRRQIKDKMLAIDLGVDGFVSKKHNR